jgi:arylsulfatase A
MKYPIALFLAFLSLSSIQAQKIKSPNIIYILADDMGSGDVKAYNKDCKFPTPHLDQMVADGVKFTDSHTSSSVCTPTRYGIVTGRYAWRTSLKRGVTHGLTEHLIEDGRTTVASYLKSKNYTTAVVGKWHMGMDWTSNDGKKLKKTGTNLDTSAAIKNGPNAFGFDYYFGISASLNMDPHAFIENDKLLGDLMHIPNDKDVRKFFGQGGKAGWVDKNFKRDAVMQTFTDKAIAWMETTHKKDAKKPFFLYFPLNAPHSPIVPSDTFKGKSKLAPHGDFCMDVDNTVGQIISAVEKMGISENTLIVFTADNGVSPQAKLEPMEAKGHFSSYIYRGLKGTLYEGGHRVPFIVKWPKVIKKAFETDYLNCTTDLLATLVDIHGEKLPENAGEDSVSFLPLLKGVKKTDADRDAIIHHSDAGVFSLRKGKWKIIFDEKGGSRRTDPKDKPVINPGKIQLFDMVKDIEESTNIATSNPNVVKELSQLMGKLLADGRSTEGEKQEIVPYQEKYQRLLAPFSKYIF